MKHIILTLTLSFFYSLNFGADLPTFISKADAFFSKYVSNGSVAYKTIKGNHGEVATLYNDVATMDMAGFTDNEKKAFYINAYNIIVIYQVTKFYPLQSPLDQSGFFNNVKHKVAGEGLTLNGLEIKKLILQFQEPRVHFALACAAKSCPPLASFAYTPDNLDQQLEKRTKEAINDKNWLQVNNGQKKVYISKIFDWYKKDFTATGMTVLEYINKYRSNKIPSSYTVDYYEYDWSLNEG